MVELGELAISSRYVDGMLTSLTVERADRTVGISTEVLAHASNFLCTDEDGHLHIADQVVYRPVKFAEGGKIIVCERVDCAR
jgi:hypothetical protein